MFHLNNQYPKFRYCDKLNLVAAKQNQKFPFHFLSAPPTPPAEEKKKGKENFWFLHTRPKGADEARISSFRQGSARNAFELCPTSTAIQNSPDVTSGLFCIAEEVRFELTRGF